MAPSSRLIFEIPVERRDLKHLDFEAHVAVVGDNYLFITFFLQFKEGHERIE